MADGYANRGACWFNSGKPEKGLKDIERAARLAPSHAPFHASRAGMLWNMGRTDEARKAANRAVKLDPSLVGPLAPILDSR